MMRDRNKSRHGLLIKIGKMKSCLLECYGLLQKITGCEGQDFLIGNEEDLVSKEDRMKSLRKLKIKIRKYFEEK